MRLVGLVMVLCLVAAPFACTQDIGGFKLGMTKVAVCEYVQTHANYSITPGSCPNLDDFAAVSVAPSDSSIGDFVKLAFVDNIVEALWADPPESDFDKLSEQLVKSYGLPERMYEMHAGSADIHAGPAKINTQGTLGLVPKKSRLVPFPGGGGANSSNYYLVWRKGKANIFLERQNKDVSGQMTGWFAIMSY